VTVGGYYCFLGCGFWVLWVPSGFWFLGFGGCGCSLGVSGVVGVCWGVLLFLGLFLGSRFVRTLCILHVY
jgi:hypothetical protein